MKATKNKTLTQRHGVSVSLSHISDHPEYPHGDVIQKEPLDYHLPSHPSPLPSLSPASLHLHTPAPLRRHRDWRQSFGSSRPQSEASPDLHRRHLLHLLHQPLPRTSAPPTNHHPRSAFTVLQSVVLTSFSMDSLKPRWLENMRVISLTWHLCVCVCKGVTVNVRVCVARDSCWQCAISVCISVRLWRVRRSFFK